MLCYFGLTQNDRKFWSLQRIDNLNRHLYEVSLEVCMHIKGLNFGS